MHEDPIISTQVSDFENNGFKVVLCADFSLVFHRKKTFQVQACLNKSYSESTQMADKWFADFKYIYKSTDDAERSGSPKYVMAHENIKKSSKSFCQSVK